MKKTSISYSLVISNNYNPYLNLAYENKLLQSVEEGQCIVFLYTNNPSIVYGRFQNPWMEFNVESAYEKGINLVRRQSGGGTVFHDRGNLNFCFIHSTTDFNKLHNNTIVFEVLEKFGLSAFASNRSDLLVEYNGPKKISGSAFKQKKDRSFHHGTLLVDCKLDELRKFLRSPYIISESKSIASNPHPVINLAQLCDSISIDTLIAAFTTVLKSKDPHLSINNIDEIVADDYYTHLISRKWIIGETPYFKIQIPSEIGELRITVKKDIIEDIELESDDNHELLTICYNICVGSLVLDAIVALRLALLRNHHPYLSIISDKLETTFLALMGSTSTTTVR